jgi:hypothetical protein
MPQTHGVAHNEKGRCGGYQPARISPSLAHVISTLPFELDSRNRLDLQYWAEALVGSIEQWRHREKRRREGIRGLRLFGRNGGGQ